MKKITLILIIGIVSCNPSIEKQIIGTYIAHPSDEISLAYENVKESVSLMGEFGDFFSAYTDLLVDEMDIRFYFYEDNSGTMIMKADGILSKLTNSFEQEEMNFNYVINNDTALYFYENDIEDKERVGTIKLYGNEIDFIKMKLNKKDYGFLYLKLTKDENDY